MRVEIGSIFRIALCVQGWYSSIDMQVSSNKYLTKLG